MRLLLRSSNCYGPHQVVLQDIEMLGLVHHRPVVVDATERLIMHGIIDASGHVEWNNH